MKTAALILAAGKRTAKPTFNPLQEVGGISALQRLVLTFQKAGIEQIVLVVGPDEDEVEKNVARMGVVFVRSETQEADMFANTLLGLNYLKNLCDQVFISPVSVPLFSHKTVEALAKSGMAVANPVCNGSKGHPLLLAGSLIPKVLAYTGEYGLSGAVASLGVASGEIEVGDLGVLLDVNHPEELENLLTGHDARQMRTQVKVQLAKDKVFFGPGTRLLLTLIENTGSVRLACSGMGVSYSKGWKMISIMEDQLGYSTVARQQGGKTGGEARLTPKGSELLRKYERFEKEAKAAVEDIFMQCFPLE